MQSVIDRETVQVKELFHRVDEVLTVAHHIEREHPQDAARLVRVSMSALASAPPIRVRIAALLLSVSDKTIRDWISEGVLITRDGHHRVQSLDPARLHEVVQLVRDLRAAGQNRDLRTSLWERLQDSALLARRDMAESLEQLRAGRLTPAQTASEEAACLDGDG